MAGLMAQVSVTLKPAKVRKPKAIKLRTVSTPRHPLTPTELEAIRNRVVAMESDGKRYQEWLKDTAHMEHVIALAESR